MKIISEIYNKDCLKEIIDYPDNYFDLLIADIPYGVNQCAHKNHQRGKAAKPKNYHFFDDSKSPDKSYFDEAIRISKNQIFWGANHFISKIPYDSPGWIIWNKKNIKTDFADCELAYTSFKKTVRIFNFRWNGMLQENMKNKEIRIHPNQKPQMLYKFCYEYANLKKGDKIIDTHLGSGNSRIVAYKMGFNFIGYEIDSVYYHDSIDYFNRECLNINKIKNINYKQESLF